MSDTDTLRFEDAFTRLEQTLEEMRRDGLALDRALALYEQGTRLVAHCDKLLADAELRVISLAPDNDSRGARVVREERTAVYIEGEW